MHQSVAVFIERTKTDTAEAVKELLDRYEGPFWDWYQIGGRWTGRLNGYEPDKDPANIKPCDLCSGTGLRIDPIGLELRQKDAGYTCNGCQGKGKRLAWPTEWRPNEGDRQPADKIPADFEPHSMVDFAGRWIEEVSAERWAKELKKDYIRKDYDVVIVDCHN